MAKLEMIQNRSVTAEDLPYGEVFRTIDYDGPNSYMKLRLPSFVVSNSAMFREKVLSGQYIFVVNLGTGSTEFMGARTLVRVAKRAVMDYRY